MPMTGSSKRNQIVSQMSKRYAPFVDWQSIVDVDVLVKQSAPRYWRTPKEMASKRIKNDLPLRGLRLALDSGHIGGQWAKEEDREFRVSENDFYVREGDLVLEVAQRVQALLTALGASVTLLRKEAIPMSKKSPMDCLEKAVAQLPFPSEQSPEVCRDYACALRDRAVRLSLVSEELAERARVVNHIIQPDALVSMHMNAAPGPEPPTGTETPNETVHPYRRLVESNNLHVLVFGCMNLEALQSKSQQTQLAVKLNNGSGAVECSLGNALARALAKATHLPPETYEKNNATLLDPDQPYLYARNLLLLRLAECPTVILEPYIANSVTDYHRIQSALAARAKGQALTKDDILVEYADAVVEGVLNHYIRND